MTDAREDLLSLIGQAHSLSALNDAMRIMRELLPANAADRKLRKQVTLLRARLRDALEADRLGLRSQTELREEELKLAQIAKEIAGEVVRTADPDHLMTSVQSLSVSLASRQPDGHAQQSGGQIFLSYRRKDSADVTARIRERLVATFGRSAVFFDVDSIPLGVNFRAHIVATLAQCKACLAIVGPDWVDICDDKGQRRLDDFNDPIRVEIETALRIDRRVIPLLVDNAQVPERDQVPDSLHGFCSQNAFNVRPDPDFEQDMSKLIELLQMQVL